MSARRSSIRRIPKDVLIRGALAAGLAVLGTAALAEDYPAFRKGKWECKRIMESGGGRKQTTATTKCANPTEDMKQQNAMLTKAGRRFSPVSRSGDRYSFSSRCDIQGISAQSKSVIQAEGDSAYRISVESEQGGESTKELLTAKRIGDC